MARKEVGKLNVSIEGDHSKLSKVLKEAESKVKQTGKVIEKESKLDVFNSQMQKALGAFAVMEFALRGVTAGAKAYGDAIEQGATKTQALVKGIDSLVSAIPVLGTAFAAGKAISEEFLVPQVERMFGAVAGKGPTSKQVRDSEFRKQFRAKAEATASQFRDKALLANPNLTAKDRAVFARDKELAAMEKKRQAFGEMLSSRGEAMENMFAPVMEQMAQAIKNLAAQPLFAAEEQKKGFSSGTQRAIEAQRNRHIEAQNKMFFGGFGKETKPDQISRGAFSKAISAFQVAGRPGEDRIQLNQLDVLKGIQKNTADKSAHGLLM